MDTHEHHAVPAAGIGKTPTGIVGFDELTFGGVPTGRTSLVCGRAGSGKTLFAMTFLVQGATLYGEHGVFMSFEENCVELANNVASLGYDLVGLSGAGKLNICHVQVEPGDLNETGDYNLEALFLRLEQSISKVGAKRVVLDTLETLFGGLRNTAVLRAELRRLFAWLKKRGVTAVITAEQGEHGLTRHGLEEYVSDCVVRLDNQVLNQIATRRLRVVKYRGSTHGPNEYPFIINQAGLSVLPVSSARLDHQVSPELVPSGAPGLDSMLGGGGFFRGSSVLVSGASGTGKSSLAAHFADASCRRGDRCIYFAFEESPQQIIRNMRSIGLDMEAWITSGLLVIEAARPSTHGLETHLTQIFQAVEHYQPASVVIDPISSLRGNRSDVYAVLLRAIDMLKERGITAFLTSLSDGASGSFGSEDGVSSLMDTWLWVTNLESNGERNRGLYVMKSRGMKHSNQIREFILTDEGVHLVDAYLGPAGVVTGSARLTQEAASSWAERQHELDLDLERRAIAKRKRALEQQMAELATAMEDEDAEIRRLEEGDGAFQRAQVSARTAMAMRRGVSP